ncbi:MAG: hypothetical protein CXR30_03015 [Geobacter sp.]|nr:MAG: hypothetical protein CXR30_03015 [Geobacter sp.]
MQHEKKTAFGRGYFAGLGWYCTADADDVTCIVYGDGFRPIGDINSEAEGPEYAIEFLADDFPRDVIKKALGVSGEVPVTEEYIEFEYGFLNAVTHMDDLFNSCEGKQLTM